LLSGAREVNGFTRIFGSLAVVASPQAAWARGSKMNVVYAGPAGIGRHGSRKARRMLKHMGGDSFSDFAKLFVKDIAKKFDIDEEELLACMPYTGMYKADIERHERDMGFLRRFYDGRLLTLAQYQTLGNFLFDQLSLDIAEKGGPTSISACRRELFDVECFDAAGQRVYEQVFLAYRRELEKMEVKGHESKKNQKEG
jgi:hypothetical protein